jgi:hypothetical protein
MPAKSKAQFRLMAAISHGGIKKPGLSKEKASEYTSVDYKSLPKRLDIGRGKNKASK